MDILEETRQQAVCVHLTEKNSCNPNNIKYLQGGKYKFKFEISKLKNNELIEIEVGFKIVYKNSIDLNFQEKNMIKNKNKKFKIGTLYDKLIITKQLVIGDNTGKVYDAVTNAEGIAKFLVPVGVYQASATDKRALDG